MRYIISLIVTAVVFSAGHGVFAADADALPKPLIPDEMVIEETYEPGNGEPVGTVDAVQGEAVILHAGILRGYRTKKDIKPEQEKELYAGILRGYRAKENLPIYKGDSIIAGASGLIRIRLKDESTMTLAANTELTIHESFFDADKAMRSAVVGMNIGKVRFRVTKLADFTLSEFKVKTNTAAVTVTGSEFVIHATRHDTEVTALVDTELKIVSLSAPESPTVLKDFERTVIPERGLPSVVEAVAPDDSRIMDDFRFAPGKDSEVIPESTEKPGKDAGVVLPDQALVPPADMGQKARAPEITGTEQQEPDTTADDVQDLQRDIPETITEQQKGKVRVSW